jgi:transposase
MLPLDADAALGITQIRLNGPVVVLEAAALTANAACPGCGVLSGSIHDRYVRRPLDLPWRGRVVRLQLTVRRFRCTAVACPRATFAEGFGPRLPRRAWRTAEADGLLLRFGWAAGGEAGARLAVAAGLPASPDTLLRLLRRHAAASVEAPRVLGIDDFAFRRGQRYGTILIDLEAHRVLDLLPDREAKTVAAWLREHPGVEIVARDRAKAYAEGIRAGAPGARQIADRFHLLQNASGALEEVLRGRRRRLESTAPPIAAAASGPVLAVPERPLSQTKRDQFARRARRTARWQQVRDLHAAGTSIQGIAHQLGMGRRTVRHYLATPGTPQWRPPPRPDGLHSLLLQPYSPYLQDRWQAGCHNVAQLFREIQALGYPGSRTLLDQATRPWRPPRPPRGSQSKRRHLSVRWLCLRPPEQLKSDEQQALEQFFREEPDLAAAYDLLQRFRMLVATRDHAALDSWLTDAEASNLQPFGSLARGIRADHAAVDGALTTAWSNGQTEGQVHRLKLIKRQGYGRAKLDLLRSRVLAS